MKNQKTSSITSNANKDVVGNAMNEDRAQTHHKTLISNSNDVTSFLVHYISDRPRLLTAVYRDEKKARIVRGVVGGEPVVAQLDADAKTMCPVQEREGYGNSFASDVAWSIALNFVECSKTSHV